MKRTLQEARDAGDEVAWQILDSRVPSTHLATTRPRNYVELATAAQEVGFEHAFSDTLHEFYRIRSAFIFALPPPDTLSRERQALLAGTAEFLCQRYGLLVPSWIEGPEYFLPDLWDPAAEEFPFSEAGRERRLGRTPLSFSRRNVIFEARNLIAL